MVYRVGLGFVSLLTSQPLHFKTRLLNSLRKHFLDKFEVHIDQRFILFNDIFTEAIISLCSMSLRANQSSYE